jgi:protein-S-isoprenylcysteine O-methyltransferase Ste14
LILLAVGLYGLVHSLLASLQMKAWTERRFGALYSRYYRLLFNFFAVVSLLPVLALLVLLPDQPLYRIPFPWAWIALAGQGLALLALVAGLKQTGAASFLGIEQLSWSASSPGSPFVEAGLYAWVRHPLYTAGLVFIWLTPVMTLNLLALYTGLTAYIAIGMYVEERKLLREFGSAYAEYRRRTPALFPLWKPGSRSARRVEKLR